MDLNGQKKATVIPIILEKMRNFEKLPFGELVAVPANLKPICDFEDQEEAWNQVNAKVSEVIEEKLEGRQGL